MRVLERAWGGSHRVVDAVHPQVGGRGGEVVARPGVRSRLQALWTRTHAHASSVCHAQTCMHGFECIQICRAQASA